MKNNMDITIRHLLICLSCFVIWSCSGNIDPEEENIAITLTADKIEIIADGEDEVIFTIMKGTQDVTSEATVSCKSGNAIVKGNVFSTTEEGIYVFTASYEGKTSEEISITAAAPTVSRFKRHVCLMEFTGTWCAQCPEGASFVNYLVEEAYKGKVFAMAFHNEDIYQIPQEQELFRKFQFGGYPGFVTDMRDFGLISGGGCSASIEKSLYEMETHCGTALKCTATANDDGTVTVTAEAKAFSEKAMNYRMAAYVIEDRVTGEQKLADNTTDEDYVHRHVVRKMLSASIAGDDLGSIVSGSEVSRSYVFTSEAGWNPENLSVAVLIIDKNGHVNNMATCSCMNGEMDYEIYE